MHHPTLPSPHSPHLAQKANVPCVPGSDGLVLSDADAIAVVAKIGLPIMIKATAGGGGRGMRLCTKQEDLLTLLHAAQVWNRV